MRLIEHYRDSIRALPAREARVLRRHWHGAAKRFLHFMSFTSDPLPPLHVDQDGITTVPYSAFFANRPVEELVELYRATKPRS